MPKIETPSKEDPLARKEFFYIPIEFFFNDDPRTFFDTTITNTEGRGVVVDPKNSSCFDLGVD